MENDKFEALYYEEQFKVADLRNELNGTKEKLAKLQGYCKKVDKENSILNRKVNRLQNAVLRLIEIR
ncbi:MAG: hypothetical protein ACRDA4_10645 [Filifactoraceae bacterium]